MNGQKVHQATEIFDCYQEVNPGGYLWFAADEEVGNPEKFLHGHYKVSQIKKAINSAHREDNRVWIISDDIPRGYPAMVNWYNPLRHEKSLFIKFANTRPEPEEILIFANQYGLLGKSVGIVSDTSLPGSIMVGQEGSTKQPLGRGELLGTWQAEIAQMNSVFEVWELVNAEDTDKLKNFFHWDDQNSVSYSKDGGCGIIASKEVHPERLERMQLGDLIVPAKYYIQGQINEYLVKAVHPQLLWNINKTPTELELFHVPTGLIGALWLQFAQAIHGDKSFHYCDQCGAVFELDPRMKGRAGRKFCSNSCRTKALRVRQAEAIRLSQKEGMKPAEIAERLESDLPTVRRWIKASKKK